MEDIEDFPWLYSQKFDLIHGRMLGTSLDDPERVIQEAVDALAPGGWLEFQDTVPPIRCDDGSWEGTNVRSIASPPSLDAHSGPFLAILPFPP